MRAIVLPAVVLLWGIGILGYHFASHAAPTHGAAQSGQSTALLFGGVMIVAGGVYLAKALRARRA